MSPPTPVFVAASTEERHRFCRDRRWLRYRRSPVSLFGEIDFVLNMEKATGRLTFEYQQGHVAVAEFHEEVRIENNP